MFEGEARRAAGAAIVAAFRAKYPDAKPEQVAAERARLERAPLVIAVVSRAAPHVKIPEWEQVLSAGAAAMNLVLAAHALGYGAAWITEWYAYDRGVLDALGLKPHERSRALFISAGRRGRPRIARGRRSTRSRPALPRSIEARSGKFMRSAIWIEIIVGSTIGGLIPALWGGDLVSYSALLLSGAGAFAGLWVGYEESPPDEYSCR